MEAAPALNRMLGSSQREALALAELRERLANLGAEPVGSSPEVFAKFVTDGRAEMGRVVREANIRLD